MPKDQAPATIPADSPIRRLYLLALIDATKHPQIHGHPTICQTAAQIAPVLTKEILATPTISLAMMSLMQMLAKDENAAMNEPQAALMKKLEEVASKDWLAALREGRQASSWLQQSACVRIFRHDQSTRRDHQLHRSRAEQQGGDGLQCIR